MRHGAIFADLRSRHTLHEHVIYRTLSTVCETIFCECTAVVLRQNSTLDRVTVVYQLQKKKAVGIALKAVQFTVVSIQVETRYRGGGQIVLSFNENTVQFSPCYMIRSFFNKDIFGSFKVGILSACHHPALNRDTNCTILPIDW